MYVVVRTQETAGTVVSYVERLHALDITSGAEQAGSPVVICSAVGDGGCSFGGPGMFVPQVKQGRPGLLLVNEPRFSPGLLFMGFAGATGCVLAYDASSLQLVASCYSSD